MCSIMKSGFLPEDMKLAINHTGKPDILHHGNVHVDNTCTAELLNVSGGATVTTQRSCTRDAL